MGLRQFRNVGTASRRLKSHLKHSLFVPQSEVLEELNCSAAGEAYPQSDILCSAPSMSCLYVHTCVQHSGFIALEGKGLL